MRAATYETCDCAPDPAHAWKLARTARTFVDKPPGAFTDWERQIVTTGFVANPEITAGVTPFWTMRRDAAATSTKLREKMGEFVAQRAINFGLAIIA